jgi:hypothetical protein
VVLFARSGAVSTFRTPPPPVLSLSESVCKGAMAAAARARAGERTVALEEEKIKNGRSGGAKG